MRHSICALSTMLALVAGPPAAHLQPSALLFTDDFETGLDRWDILGVDAVAIHETADPAHGSVLQLTPNGDVLALMRGSESWGRVRVEGDMFFPSPHDNYLGLVYHHRVRNDRRDFGLIYIKGNESYLQLNPHRDFNVSRTLYPEFHVELAGPSTVVTGKWQTFALEVSGQAAHLYVGATTTPQLTFADLEIESGALGFQPRSVGAPVWIDNVTVRRLDALSYNGPPVPAPGYARDQFLTDWRVAGPFTGNDDAIARRPQAHTSWRPLAADARGAVVTGSIVDYHGPRTAAYFRTTVRAAAAGPAELQFSTVDDIAVWANGRFLAFLARQDLAWFDAHATPERRGRRLPLTLQSGDNEIVVRVRGGAYASGGFFARLVKRS